MIFENIIQFHSNSCFMKVNSIRKIDVYGIGSEFQINDSKSCMRFLQLTPSRAKKQNVSAS